MTTLSLRLLPKHCQFKWDQVYSTPVLPSSTQLISNSGPCTSRGSESGLLRLWRTCGRNLLSSRESGGPTSSPGLVEQICWTHLSSLNPLEICLKRSHQFQKKCHTDIEYHHGIPFWVPTSTPFDQWEHHSNHELEGLLQPLQWITTKRIWKRTRKRRMLKSQAWTWNGPTNHNTIENEHTAPCFTFNHLYYALNVWERPFPALKIQKKNYQNTYLTNVVDVILHSFHTSVLNVMSVNFH